VETRLGRDVSCNTVGERYKAFIPPPLPPMPPMPPLAFDSESPALLLAADHALKRGLPRMPLYREAADFKQGAHWGKVIESLARVTTVNVETLRIVGAMPEPLSPDTTH